MAISLKTLALGNGKSPFRSEAFTLVRWQPTTGSSTVCCRLPVATSPRTQWAAAPSLPAHLLPPHGIVDPVNIRLNCPNAEKALVGGFFRRSEERSRTQHSSSRRTTQCPL